MKYYSGIGSRKTPVEIRSVLTEIAEKLAKKGYVLRSGGAAGADQSFEAGCLNAGGAMEIFLPWNKYEGKTADQSQYMYTRELDYNSYSIAKRLAETYHPTWDTLTNSVKQLHTRNVHIVLGVQCDTPSRFVVCYTEDENYGGTSQALRIARQLEIPVFNLAKDNSVPDLVSFLKS